MKKKYMPCSMLTNYDSLIDYSYGPTLRACQTLYKKGICTFGSNYYSDGSELSICFYYNDLSEENKKIILQKIKEYPENYQIQASYGFHGLLKIAILIKEIDEELPMQIVLGIQNFSVTSSDEELLSQIDELAQIFKKQEFRYGVFNRNEVLRNMHNKLVKEGFYTWINKNKLTPCLSDENNTNSEIAINEGLIYSEKYDLFFANQDCKSRYIESLYTKENDNRNETDIAIENGVFYSKKKKMFFEDKEEYLRYIKLKKQYKITEGDIAKASIKMKIGDRLIDKVRNVFERLKNLIR